MSEQNEIEKLRAKRVELEAESRSLKEGQKNLEYSVMVLEERVAIEELRNVNKTMKDALSQLDAKKNGLEAKLKQVSQTSDIAPPSKPVADAAAVPEPPAGEPKLAEAASEEPEEDTVTVTAIGEESTVEAQEAVGEDLKRQQEKKKRRLF
jgi:hypothetical protein